MEDVYTIKVKTKPDTRNLYPSERRYSASTVSGLAWVHIALAATSFLLACLALINSNSEIGNSISNNGTTESQVSKFENKSTSQINLNASKFEWIQNGRSEWNDSTFENDFMESENGIFNDTSVNQNGTLNATSNINYMLVLAPTLITIFGLAAGIASFFASIKWYIDHNITWLFIMSTLSTIVSLTSFIMVIVWFVTSDGDITEFYKDRDPFKEYFVVKHTDVIVKNDSHMIVALNTPLQKDEQPNLFTKHVLSINILIAAFLELLWSILSVKISYKGMKNNYKEDIERRGNCVSVVTKIKGNDSRKPRNGHSKADFDNLPSKKIKRVFLAQSDNGFYLKSQQKTKQHTETSSEIYKERIMSFLNRCASLEGDSNPGMRTPSVQSEPMLNPIPEGASIDTKIDLNPQESNERPNRVTPVSWGDTPDHTIYNQNTLNLEKIFNFKPNNTTTDTRSE